MDHATGAMGSLLLKLGELLKEEYDLQRAVKKDIQYFKRELESMQAALRKVGDVPRDQLDEQVKLWANEVRDLSYIMEDIIDKFLVHVEGPELDDKPHKLKQLMKKMGDLFTKGKSRHDIGKEMKAIKGRLQEAADRRDRYRVNGVVVNPVGAITVDPRLLALYKDQKELVGIDDSLNELIKMMSDGDGDASKELKILSIFGFGGLGKTTLAKAVYDKLKAQFDCSAFVPVGRNPSVKKLLNDILFGIDKNMYPELDERQLIDKLRELLENKRYLIVIDDIWDKKTWGLVKTALVCNNCGSRIITTTRIQEVATTTSKVYKLQPLSLGSSKDLFHRRLSCGEFEWPKHLSEEEMSNDEREFAPCDYCKDERLDELERLETQDLLRQERAEKRAEDLAQARAKKRAEEIAKRAARVEAKVAAEEAAKRRRPPSDDDDGAAGTSADDSPLPSDDDDGAAGTSAKKQKIE